MGLEKKLFLGDVEFDCINSLSLPFYHSTVSFFFSYDSHFGIHTRLKFTRLKPCSMAVLHVKFKNDGCSGLEIKSSEWT